VLEHLPIDNRFTSIDSWWLSGTRSHPFVREGGFYFFVLNIVQTNVSPAIMKRPKLISSDIASYAVTIWLHPPFLEGIPPTTLPVSSIVLLIIYSRKTRIQGL